MSILKMDKTAKKIAKALIDKEIDYRVLAKKIGVSESMLYRFLNRQQKSLKAHVLEAIEKELNMNDGENGMKTIFYEKQIEQYKRDLAEANRRIGELETLLRGASNAVKK